MLKHKLWQLTQLLLQLLTPLLNVVFHAWVLKKHRRSRKSKGTHILWLSQKFRKGLKGSSSHPNALSAINSIEGSNYRNSAGHPPRLAEISCRSISTARKSRRTPPPSRADTRAGICTRLPRCEAREMVQLLSPCYTSCVRSRLQMKLYIHIYMYRYVHDCMKVNHDEHTEQNRHTFPLTFSIELRAVLKQTPLPLYASRPPHWPRPSGCCCYHFELCHSIPV